MSFDFQTKAPVSKIFVCLLGPEFMIWVDKRKKSLKTQIIFQLSQMFCGILESC